jgi:hypothetical protein
MKKEDENELYRLTDMLKSISIKIDPASPYHEGLKKGALALQSVFIHGYRSEIEEMYDSIEKPLSTEEIEHLKRLGIEPNRINKE